MPQQPQHIIVTTTKSTATGILPRVEFGPLGLLYYTIAGALTMIVFTLVIGATTLGFGPFFTWPVAVIWAAVTVNSYNAMLLNGNSRQ